jgi:hypothetical protein
MLIRAEWGLRITILNYAMLDDMIAGIWTTEVIFVECLSVLRYT